ncbi:MAG: methyltransferase domain-containing protein [Acetatifactor sp.]|nr:methyltransferase domain-containing protein [Acetatifactor sp.]
MGKRKYILARITGKFYELQDYCIDRKVCGMSIRRYVPSIFRDDKAGVGMTGSEATVYAALHDIFSAKELKITAEDSFLDVGCGQGRVLAYLIHKQYPCKIAGIEINEEVGKMTAQWAAKYPDVKVVVGDAFEHNMDPYTVLFFGRPFLPETFKLFLEKLEGDLNHPITFIYHVDQQSKHLLEGRPGWTMLMRKQHSKWYGVPYTKRAQYYSIWRYEPVK